MQVYRAGVAFVNTALWAVPTVILGEHAMISDDDKSVGESDDRKKRDCSREQRSLALAMYKN